jgi:hypothetical protein
MAGKTNTQSNTAFRGFGGPQGMAGIERVIDEIAFALARDDVRDLVLGPIAELIAHWALYLVAESEGEGMGSVFTIVLPRIENGAGSVGDLSLTESAR